MAVLVLVAMLLASTAGPAAAQEDKPQAPLPPPAAAPASRLTITPSEFERWLAGVPEGPDVAAIQEDPQPGPGLAAPPPPRLTTPPPPPALVTPPPPRLTAPPAAAKLPDAPAIPAAPPGSEPPVSTRPGTPAPPPAPVLTPPEAPQVATLPPASRETRPAPAAPPLSQPTDVRILYRADATDLPEAAHRDLDGLANWLKANPDARVRIVGYASTATAAGSDARRRSLFRTLAVRTYLIENGVLSTRMDVRALGDRTEEEPKDRVEVWLPPP